MPCRVDRNQAEIVKAIRKMGSSVWITSDLGKGAPDLVVGVLGYNLLVEIKDGEKSPSQRKLTPSERNFHESWKGQICVIESIDQAIQFINDYRKGIERAQTFIKDCLQS